jgi:hypothetical protein
VTLCVSFSIFFRPQDEICLSMINPENLLIAVMMHAGCVFNFTVIYYTNLVAELCFCSRLMWS